MKDHGIRSETVVTLALATFLHEMAIENLSPVEISLLEGRWDSQVMDLERSVYDLAKMVVECQFRNALLSQTARRLFRISSANLDGSFQDSLDLSMGLRGGDSIHEEVERLALAVACLHAFIQANWTGPDLDVSPLEVLTNYPSSLTEEIINTKAISELAYGGEPAYHLAKVPTFLRLSQILLALPYKHLHSIPWWKLRTHVIHQRILDDPVSLPIDFRTSLEALSSTLSANPGGLPGRMFLELGLLEHLFSHDKSAAEYFVKAARSTGLEYELTGALGKRTKFQQTEITQLVLLAESQLEKKNLQGALSQKEHNYHNSENSTANGRRINNNNNIPENLALNDDTLLEQTEFTSSNPAGNGSRLCHIDPSAQPPLHPLDQCILLSLCLNVRNTSPSHGLTTEQMTPYVSRVISHARNWSVHTMALLLRSRLESSRTRTVERSTFQLQALIDQMPSSDSTTSERLLYFHSIPMPTRWEMEKELAQRFLSLGVVKSALEIFERLEMWEDVVKCYSALEKPEKGIVIVRDLLEGRKAEAEAIISRGKSNTGQRQVVKDAAREAKLWCLLGDLEPDNAVDHYEHAWTISKETSGRAMRSLGGYYFARGKYPEAIISLKQAVKINPLLTRSWFILGCASMRVEDWESAKNAFSRCVSIDEEDGESWNNLASMYLRMGIASKTSEIDEVSESTSTPLSQASKKLPFYKLEKKKDVSHLSVSRLPRNLMDFPILFLLSIKCLRSVLSNRVCGTATKIGECGTTIWWFPWMSASFKRHVGLWVV